MTADIFVVGQRKRMLPPSRWVVPGVAYGSTRAGSRPWLECDSVFLTSPGSVWSILDEGGGALGAPSELTAEKSEEFLVSCTPAVVDVGRDLEGVYDRIEPGYLPTRSRR